MYYSPINPYKYKIFFFFFVCLIFRQSSTAYGLIISVTSAKRMFCARLQDINMQTWTRRFVRFIFAPTLRFDCVSLQRTQQFLRNDYGITYVIHNDKYKKARHQCLIKKIEKKYDYSKSWIISLFRQRNLKTWNQ